MPAMIIHIVLIGWLYVTVLVAATETSLIAGILTFILYGGIPCCLILYFATSKTRRRYRAHRERLAEQQERRPKA